MSTNAKLLLLTGILTAVFLIQVGNSLGPVHNLWTRYFPQASTTASPQQGTR